ncbi:dsRNA-binding domain-like protein [Yamadazyma tenuis ATCC 10573]|uniref:DNA repair and recombination protein RAD52 n=1 Tax=Candida tenuis (strain ATCC 10573 / BCRC 21748 / CBS 615 / JCM 9827 / NBRC 10315 / NRRL Y-1498 / VKM Y-70) TaxID=590646 RepID=G3BAD1_CANTC|nr:dsRNA-binding domain-like protein [Yamadazyma tenuis ATCC 10573]EGV62033.1 dsRNA-binding domain-like protein [Yamadazyma tenuis ATCC 10573]
MSEYKFVLNNTGHIHLPEIEDFLRSEDEEEIEDLTPLLKVASLWGQSKIGTLQARLEMLQTRSTNKSYELPNHRIMSLANEVFGFAGWSTSLSSLEVKEQVDHCQSSIPGDATEYNVTAWAKVLITLKDGTVLESSGKSNVQKFPDKGMAYRTAKMSAVTNAVKTGIMMLPVLAVENEEN